MARHASSFASMGHSEGSIDVECHAQYAYALLGGHVQMATCAKQEKRPDKEGLSKEWNSSLGAAAGAPTILC